MLVKNKPEYKQLVSWLLEANKSISTEQAEWMLEEAMIDIEYGEASYLSAAKKLGFPVGLSGQCGFDAADYLSAIV